MLGSRTVDRLLSALLHPIVAAWRKASDSSWRRLPRPLGEPIVHSTGPDVLRLLLVGGGIAVGYGTSSHEVALGGNLARRITALTGRGTSVQILAGANEQMAGAPKLLAQLDLGIFDGIVATFGGAESATFLSPRRWRRDLELMLDFVEAAGPHALPVFIGAVPLIDSIPGVWGTMARRRALELNNQSRLVCKGRESAYFAAIDPLSPRVQVAMNRDAYRAWGESLAPPIAAVLRRAAQPI